MSETSTKRVSEMTEDEIRAMAGDADPQDAQALLSRELQSANAVIMRQMAEIAELREALAAVREYRIYVDEDGDGIRMHGPCAETIGCLFGRLFDAYPSMHEDIGLGLLIDAALAHERDKERLHADQMRSEQEPAGPPAGDGDFWSSGPSLVELDAYGDFAPGRRDPDKAADEE